MTGFAALPLSRALFVLLLIGAGGASFVVAAHASRLAAAGGIWLSLVGFGALALLTLHAIWQRKVWGPWAALAVASGILTIALYGWASRLDSLWPPATAALAIAAIVIAFIIGEPASATLTRRQRTFFAIIFAFPAWVAAGGLFLPGQIDQFLPFKVPPLHAFHRRRVHRWRGDDAARRGVERLAYGAGRDRHPRRLDRGARHRVAAACECVRLELAPDLVLVVCLYLVSDRRSFHRLEPAP